LYCDEDNPADREKLRRAILDLVAGRKNAKAKRAWLKFSRVPAHRLIEISNEAAFRTFRRVSILGSMRSEQSRGVQPITLSATQ